MSEQKEHRVTLREVAHTAGRVARLLKTSHTTKKHGGYDHYKDDRIHIRLDTYVPNVDIGRCNRRQLAHGLQRGLPLDRPPQHLPPGQVG